MALAAPLPFLSESAYARRSGMAQRILFDAQDVVCRPVQVFPDPEPGFYDFSDAGYRFPAVTLTTFQDVLVRGRSNLLTAQDAVLLHDLLDLATDVPAEEFEGRLRFGPDGLATWEPQDPFNVDYLPEAAAFTDGAAWNYAHWMTEVLPRAAAFLSLDVHAGVPLIIDAELHANIVRSINLAAGPDRLIYRLGGDQLVRVGILHQVSPTAYARYKPRGQSRSAISNGVFSTQALSRMVDRIRAALEIVPAQGERPRLFLRRNAALRQLVNQEAIQEALETRGFVVVEPERLTFDEQVALFSSAEIVVACAGAAVTNLLFCPSDCPMVTLGPRTAEVGYWYWRNIAAAVDVRVIAVTGEIRPDLGSNPQGQLVGDLPYLVDVRDVLDAIAAA